MNVFDFAIDMEHDGEDYYRKMADRMSLPGIKTIFNFLADEEVRHAKILKQMMEGRPAKLSQSQLLGSAQSIFKEIQKNMPEFNVQQADYEVYDHALELERRSESFYRSEAEKGENQAVKNALLDIADEEKRHVRLLEHLKTYASHPHQWIESSEFNHLEHY